MKKKIFVLVLLLFIIMMATFYLSDMAERENCLSDARMYQNLGLKNKIEFNDKSIRHYCAIELMDSNGKSVWVPLDNYEMSMRSEGKENEK